MKIKKSLRGIRDFVLALEPVKLVFLGYFAYIVVGWLVLCLPFSQHGQGATALDNLFTSTSAVSTTGLATVSTSDNYSLFGEIVVLVLIQLGGLGYMTVSSFVILSRKRELSERRVNVGGSVFSLPQSFRIDKFIRSVITFTLVIEAVGAVALYAVFRANGMPNSFWSAIFHSVSSFCTAGFSLYNSSFEAFSGSFWLNVIVAILSYLGAVGFIVCIDVWRRFTNRIPSVTLTTKIILQTTLWLSIAGALFVFLTEPSIQSKAPEQRLLTAFFQAMTSLTTVGFNTIPIAAMSKATLLAVTILMVIGASPSGTGGGLKSTTFSAILSVMRSALRGERVVRFYGHPIPEERVQTAVASLGFYITFLLIGTLLLALTEAGDFEGILFEAASALGTVGLSTGITPALTELGKLIIILLMFSGRLGPLTFGMALVLRPRPKLEEHDKDVAM
ncbi:MAG: potassium transporter KtrB [Verrucomicrobia bacterium]|nr:potassium transporter KtrB [Verrucomicrobiota bacterium]